MPILSVIVPVYNSEKYLSKCIQSLVDQTLKDIEIILVDDGSTDKSHDIMMEFNEKYPEMIRIITKKNGGQATARNMGISCAKGDYIGFLDSDDWADIDMYKELYEKAKESDYDLVECLYHYQKEDGTELKPYGYVRKYSSNKDMFIDSLVSPWNKLVKRSIFLNDDKWFTEGCIYEDTAFFVKIIPYIKTSEIVEKKLIFHIDRDGSTMNSNRSYRVANIFPVMEDAISFYKEKDFYNSYKLELEYFWVKILLCSSFRRIALISDQKIRKKFVDDTFRMIDCYFPDYRTNPYFDNDIKGKYVKSINRITGRLFVEFFHLKR